MSVMVTTEKETGVVPVVNADWMDDDTFFKHMSKRHRDSLGGLHRIFYVSEVMSEIWRTFHDSLHHLRIDLDHEHND